MRECEVMNGPQKGGRALCFVVLGRLGSKRCHQQLKPETNRLRLRIANRNDQASLGIGTW